jgi:hypothetical protein
MAVEKAFHRHVPALLAASFSPRETHQRAAPSTSIA